MEHNNIYRSVFKVTHSGGSGSCFYLKNYDLFVTNYHVVEGYRTVAVHDNDRNPYLAKVVLVNPALDIALLAAEGDFSALPEMTLAADDSLTIGRKVYVAGYPYGMPFTITEGSVSSPKQLMDGKYYIQTDAAVNPGNSGGALVNTHGELVGINTLIKSQTGSYVGYSFAIPESIVRKVVVDLKEFGVVQRALLGGADVIVADGYSGNILLKTVEGAAKLLLGEMKKAFLSSTKSKLGALLVKDSLGDVKKLLDPSEVGGTPFLGISKPVLKAHGSSDARAIRNAVFRAVEYAQSGIIADVEAHIDVMKVEKNG